MVPSASSGTIITVNIYIFSRNRKLCTVFTQPIDVIDINLVSNFTWGRHMG